MNIFKTYPKLLSLVATFIVAYILAHLKVFDLDPGLFIGNDLWYMLAGAMYSFGFTAAFGVILLLSLPEGNIFLQAIIGGIGSLFTDLMLFWLVRSFFISEVTMLFNTKYFLIFHSKLSDKIKKYGGIIMGLIFIASPLPDEIGVFLLASTTNLKERTFSILAYSLNTVGIFIILLLR